MNEFPLKKVTVYLAENADELTAAARMWPMGKREVIFDLKAAKNGDRILVEVRNGNKQMFVVGKVRETGNIPKID